MVWYGTCIHGLIGSKPFLIKKASMVAFQLMVFFFQGKQRPVWLLSLSNIAPFSAGYPRGHGKPNNSISLNALRLELTFFLFNAKGSP